MTKPEVTLATPSASPPIISRAEVQTMPVQTEAQTEPVSVSEGFDRVFTRRRYDRSFCFATRYQQGLYGDSTIRRPWWRSHSSAAPSRNTVNTVAPCESRAVPEVPPHSAPLSLLFLPHPVQLP